MPVGIEFRMAKLRGDAFLEPFGDEMFKPFSLLMNFFHRIIENLVEIGLDQPMMAEYFQCAAPSFRRQSNTAPLFVFHIRWSSRSELLQHVRDRCGRDSQTLSEGSTRNGLPFRTTEGKDRLQVVVHGLSIDVHLAIRGHGVFSI